MELDTPQIKSALTAIAEKYIYEKQHSEKVQSLALSLFDWLKPIHGLGEEARILLSHGALLHDIGIFVNLENHNEISAYLIKHEKGLDCYPERQREMLSYVVKAHRGEVNEEFASELTDTDRKAVLFIGAILRVADALDGYREAVEAIKTFDMDSEKAVLRLKCIDELEHIRNNVAQKHDLFIKMYKRELVLYREE